MTSLTIQIYSSIYFSFTVVCNALLLSISKYLNLRRNLLQNGFQLKLLDSEKRQPQENICIGIISWNSKKNR